MGEGERGESVTALTLTITPSQQLFGSLAQWPKVLAWYKAHALVDGTKQRVIARAQHCQQLARPFAAAGTIAHKQLLDQQLSCEAVSCLVRALLRKRPNVRVTICL